MFLVEGGVEVLLPIRSEWNGPILSAAGKRDQTFYSYIFVMQTRCCHKASTGVALER
jgi:hypothetical protein